jgi:hypothetical protein
LAIDLKPEKNQPSTDSDPVVEQTASLKEEAEEPSPPTVRVRAMELHMITSRSSDSPSLGPNERPFDDPRPDELDNDFPAFPVAREQSCDKLPGSEKSDNPPDDDMS